MKIDPEDSKWTAYVLDELDAEARRQLESELAASPEARQWVEEIRETVGQLAESAEPDPAMRLDEDQLRTLFPPVSLVHEPDELEVDAVPVSFWQGGQIRAAAAAVALLGAVAVMIIPPLVRQPEGTDPDPGLASVTPRSQPFNEEGGPNNSLNSEGLENPLTPNLAQSEPEAPNAAQRLFHRLGAGSRQVESVFSRPFVAVSQHPVASCALEVGTEAYEYVRQAVWREELPEPKAVRVDEMVNYFSYDYAAPSGAEPMALHLEAATCPWNARHRLVRVGLKGRSEPRSESDRVNVVMLVDGIEIRRSGFDRAGFLQVLTALRSQLKPFDQLVVIDGSRLGGPVKRVLQSETAVQVLESITQLASGGSMDIGVSNQWVLSKILPELHLNIRNEVVMVSGGIDPVRTTERLRLLALLDDVRPADLRYSVLSLNTGEQTYAITATDAPPEVQYQTVSSVAQADRFWSELLHRNPVRVANDVRLKLEFNPERVQAYRLVGQNPAEVDGEAPVPVGDEWVPFRAGQELTALYEIVPADAGLDQRLLTAKLDYRLLDDGQRIVETYPLEDPGTRLPAASRDFKFSASVAAYGMLISDAPFRGTINHYGVLELAQQGLGEDAKGHRKEFLELVKRTLKLILQRNGRVNG